MSQKHWDRMTSGISSTIGVKSESITQLVPKWLRNWSERKPKSKEMKPTRECGQQERMLRALLVLDGMTGHFEDIMNEADAKTPIEHFVHDVYKIAHAAHGTCCEDSEWLDRIDVNAKILNDAKLMNLEKVLGEIKSGDRKKKKKSSGGMLQAMGLKD